jgi:hypothetical protein
VLHSPAFPLEFPAFFLEPRITADNSPAIYRAYSFLWQKYQVFIGGNSKSSMESNRYKVEGEILAKNQGIRDRRARAVRTGFPPAFGGRLNPCNYLV